MRKIMPVAVAALALSVLLSACTSGTGQAGATAPTGLPTDVLPVLPTDDPVVDPQQTDVFSVAVGDCLNDSADLFVEEVPLVDCAGEHDLEVFDEFEVGGDGFDPVRIGEEADAGCTARFEAFIGLAYDASTLDVVSYKPTGQSWFTGDRLISCMVQDPGGKTVGTLRGAAR